LSNGKPTASLTARPQEPPIAIPFDQRRIVRDPRFVPLVFLGGLLLSLAGAALTRHGQTQRTDARLQTEVAVATGDLGERIKSYLEIMRGVRGLARAAGGIDSRTFHDYIAGVALAEQHRGLLAISFGVRVEHSGRAAFEQRMQAELGSPDRPFAIRPPGQRPDYFVVVSGEPEEANRNAIGFDALSIPGQRASLDAAIDRGAMVASAPMKVIQYDGPDPCLLLRLPVYTPGLATATPAQRRQAFMGSINAVFRARELIQEALGPETLKQLQVWVEDRGTPERAEPGSPMGPLYGSPFPAVGRFAALIGSRHETERRLEVGGRVWLAHFRARPELVGDLDWPLPLGVFMAGFVVSALLAGLLKSLGQTGQRARQLALRMTEQLQRNEARLQAIAQAIPDLLFVLDEDGRYLEIHGRQEGLLAAPREALLGRTVTEILPTEVAGICMAAITAALDSHQLQTVSYELATGSGQTCFEARLVEMDTPPGGKRCVVLVSRDVTERSRAEENLRMTQKLESLGVLAGGIAHDFNNLLTAILGNLNLAQEHIAEDSRATPLLRRVETTVLRASELAHQMLAYSGRGTLQVANLDLNHVVGEMTDLLRVSISKRVALDIDLAMSLPPILADGVQIQQVVMNLVTNASESMADQDGRIRVSTAARHLNQAFLDTAVPTQRLGPGLFVILEVADTGCGMEVETLNRIFDPFFTTKSTGRGLGLSAMLGILRGHGAGISIQSRTGSGSTFRIFFPAAGPGNPAGPARAPETARGQTLGGTVLVVDDEEMVRETAVAIVRNLGMAALEAADGAEALSLFELHRQEIDLVLMDITMPRMDGNEAFLAIRRLDPVLPVILCSGFTVQEVVQPPAGTRPADFIQKPYRLATLKKALQVALQGTGPKAGP
jgi:PAS domain S-box-containing protein